LLLISDILDLSKIEAGRIDLVYESVRIADIKAETFTLFDELAKNRKIRFGIELSSGLPDCIMTDRLRISQVIRNLLSNAFKFTEPSGEVMLRFRRSTAGGAPAIEISVQDTGIGIGAEQQEMIFEAFHQADGSISRKYGGTGLGLSITRMLTGLMGGTVTLSSRPGEGSTFYVHLPLEPPKQKLPGDEMKMLPPATEKKFKKKKQYPSEGEKDNGVQYLHTVFYRPKTEF
jgi:signal transduction histidine kinase